MTDDIGPGHNQPPEEPEKETTAELLDRVRELVANANRWRAERPKILDTEMAGAAQRFMEQLRTVRQKIQERQKLELEPIVAAEFIVRAQFKDPLSMVEIALNGVVLANTDWLQRERDKLDDERRRKEQEADAAIVEAARLSHEAQKPGATVEAQLAASKAEERAAELTDHALAIPTRPQIRDDQSTRAMSLRATWKARIKDEVAALKSYARHPDVRAAALAQVVKTATREAKLQKDPKKAKPGIEYYTDERAA